MTTSIAIWLTFALCSGLIGMFGNIRQALLYGALAWVMLPLSFAPLGLPQFYDFPQGKFTVLGAKIDEPRAIYVLIDGDNPRYYVLPYSKDAANELQKAMDGVEAHGGRMSVVFGEDDSIGFAEEVPAQEVGK